MKKSDKVKCLNCHSLMKYKITSPCVVCGAKKEEIKKFKSNKIKYSLYHVPICARGTVLVCESCSENFVNLISIKSNILYDNQDIGISFWTAKRDYNYRNYSKDYVCIRCGQKRALQQIITSIKKEPKLKGISSLNWTKYVKKIFPKIYNKKEHETFYSFLFDLDMLLDKKYSKKDTNFIKKVHKFAEMCYRSKSYYISNAISVSFYEHLTNFPISVSDLALIPKDILNDAVIPLTKLMKPQNYSHLLKLVEELKKMN